MAINPIALQVKPVDTRGALNTLAAVRQMQASAQQQQMNQLAIEDAQRKRSTEEAFKNALMTGGYKTPEGMNRLMGIDPTAALALKKNLLDEEAARKSAIKSDLELFSKAAGGMPDTAENYSYLYNGAVKDNPGLASFLPSPNMYKPGLLTQFGVGAKALYDRQTQEAAGQSRIDAANIRAAAARDAAERASQRPISVGGNLVSPTGEVLFEGKPKPEVPKVTDLMAEYRLALEEGFEGTFTDYKQQFGSKTQAPKNVVLPPGASLVDPSGKVLHTNPMSSKSKPMTVKAGDTVIDEEGNVIYQSEPPPPKETTEERERAKLKVKEEANAPMAAAKIENIVQSATRLKELASELYDPVERKAHPGLSLVTGKNLGREFFKEGTSFFSQNAANAKAIQDTIADMIFITVVNEMKALAQTGATGLGSITEKEGAKIQKSYQNLISTQDTETYQRRLQDLIQQVDDSIKIINEAAGRSGGGGNEKKSLKDIFGD